MTDALRHLGAAATLPDGSANPLSQAVVANGLLFISGLMPKDGDGQLVAGDITIQTEVVMRRLGQVLALAGCGYGDLVKVTVWLTDAGDFQAFNAAYSAFLVPPYPARSAVRCDLLLPTARLEIEAIARLPQT